MNTADRLSVLKELHALRRDEVLSEEEFLHERKSVLASHRSVRSVLDTLVHLLKPLAWPVVVLIALFSLREPLISKLNEAKELSIGSFSLKVKERAEMIGDPELARSLSGLSQRAIELLMDTGDKNMYAVTTDDAKEPISVGLDKLAYSELDGKGLLSGPEPYGSFIKWATSLPGKKSSISDRDEYVFDKGALSETDKQRLNAASFTLSDKGRRLWRLVAKVVAEQLTTPPTHK